MNGRARALASRADIPPDIRRIAEILADQSDRITRIVEQLMTFARHTTPKRIEVGLREPVRDVVELFEMEARRHDVRIEFNATSRFRSSMPMPGKYSRWS